MYQYIFYFQSLPLAIAIESKGEIFAGEDGSILGRFIKKRFYECEPGR